MTKYPKKSMVHRSRMRWISKEHDNQCAYDAMFREVESVDEISKRWTDAEKEEAIAILNDIHEQEDNGEGRGALRKALAILVDTRSDHDMKCQVAKAELVSLLTRVMKREHLARKRLLEKGFMDEEIERLFSNDAKQC